eukprot:Pgem_evm1s2113
MGGEDTLSKYLSELYPQKFHNVTQSTRLLLAYLCIAFRNIHLLHSINALTSERIDKFQNLSQYRGFLKRKDTATNMEPKVHIRRRLQLQTLQEDFVSLPGGNITPKRRK